MADNIKILVVDDERVVIRSCELVLKAEGYDIEGASSGKDAILKMEKTSYNLVLTDLNMPEM
ncbi:MAG: response regulator, partial [Nitrospirota bacterium]|nr:response regulator [Nitrospirota bacterium]